MATHSSRETHLTLPDFCQLDSISQQRQEELREAIGDAPIVVLYNLVIQQLFGWPAYLIRNASGQRRYPKFTNREFLVIV